MKTVLSFPNSHIQSKACNKRMKHMELVIQIFCYKLHDTDTSEILYKKNIRQTEFDICLSRNAMLPFIKKLHLFLEYPEDQSYYENILGDFKEKCIFIPFGKQPHYKDILSYVNEKIPENTITCIMNSDILLDPSMPISLIEKYVKGPSMFGITRHEYTNPEHTPCNIDTCNLIYNYWGSHDAFILRTPLLQTIEYTSIDFKQNIFGAEAIFQKALKNAGYTMKNPCFQIKLFHLHRGKIYFEQYDTIGNHNDFMEAPSMLDE